MKKKRFINPHVPSVRQQGFKDFLLWKAGYFDEEKGEENKALTVSYPCLSPFSRTGPSVTWVNHSTFLLSVGGVHILTDPIWSKRCSPLAFLGPKRRHRPGILLSDLPKIDIVLISHNHYDHLDRWTVLELANRFPCLSWFVPMGVKRWFDRHLIAPVYELGWWDEWTVGLPHHPELKIKITAVPAQHFSGRRGYDLNRSLWVGWVLEIDMNKEIRRCYFVGDTGYNPFDFKKIGERFAPIDLSLIPIGAYQPKAFMQTVHVSPDEAVRIHQDVGSKLSLGMHWKTFRLSDEPIERPPHDLYQALLNEKIDPATFIVTEPGHEIHW